MGHFKGDHHDQVIGDIGHDFRKDHPRGRGADSTGGGDIFAVAHLKRRGAHDHGKAIPEQETKHHDHHLKRAAEDRHHGKRHKHHRHGQAYVDQEGHHHIDAPAEITRSDTHCRSDHTGNQRRDHADHQGHPSAIDQPREVVAPKVVGAKRMLPIAAEKDGWLHAGHQALGIGIMRGKQRREDRDQQQEAHHRGTDQQALVAKDAFAQHLGGGRADDILEEGIGGIGHGHLSCSACGGQARRSKHRRER